MFDGGISLSLRWLFLLMVLAVVSASIGALAALWLRESPTNVTDIEPPAEQVAESQDPAPPIQSPEADPTPAAPPAATPASSTETPRAAATQPTDPPETTQPRDLSPPPAAVAAVPDASPVDEQIETPAEPNEPEALLTPLTVSVTPPSVRQGETVVLTVDTDNHDGTVVAIVRGPSGRWPALTLTPYGDESWGILGVPRDTPVGFYSVTVDLHDPNGRWQQTLTAGLTVRPSDAPLEEIWLEGGLGEVNQEAVRRDHEVRFVEHITVSGPPRWSGAWLRPVAGEDSGYFGSPRMYNGVMGDQWHHGHDIAANHGDWIVAPAHGVVVWTGDLALHGIGVILDHGAGVYSGYWHMSLIAVNIGAEVEPGDWLGNIGTTGLSTGPHLHWEVIIQGVDVDPLQWLSDDRPRLPAALTAAAAPEEQEAVQIEGEQPDGG